MKKVIGSLAIACLALVVSGCATNSVPAGTLPATAAHEELAATENGAVSVDEVTSDEYEAAFTAFSDCMTKSGAAIILQETVGQVHYFSFPSSAEADYQRCYSGFQSIDVAWQLQNEYDNPTQVALRACLEAAGVTPAKTVAEVWEQIQGNKIDPVACTTR